MKKLAVLFFILVGLFSGTVASAETTPAPEFTLRDIKGKKVSLLDFKDRVVFISFWATWCAPCKSEMPHLQAFHEELEDKGLTILSISIDNSKDASRAKAYIKENKYNFTVLLDKQTTVVSLYNPSKKVPFSVLINKEGNIVWTKTGFHAGEEVEVKNLILKELGLEEQAVEKSEKSSEDKSEQQ